MNLPLSPLLVVPIVLPLVSAALLLLLDDRRWHLKSLVNVGTTLASLLVALYILQRVDAGDPGGTVGVYLAGNWEAPFGIALVADRLSALMLVLTGVVGLCSAVYASAAWSRAGVYFHALFQIQLMGLHGAFLTGDLFNLFVFFEVMLAASYGLHLHGSGWARVRAGLHYIAVNLLASSLFLIGLAMLYGITGTLCMADLAAKLPQVPAHDRGLLHAGFAILAVAFLTKAAMWPLNLWLVRAYTTTSAPVAALFALMSKVGIYTLLRLSTLFFSGSVGVSTHFGASVFLYGGLATLLVAIVGIAGTTQAARIAGYSILVSSGTLLATMGLGGVAMTSAALYYLLSATLAASALFLLVELLQRASASAPAPLPDIEAWEDTNLDERAEPLVGREIPLSHALLGLTFVVSAVLVAGLPPLSGFVAKLALLTTAIRPAGYGIEAPLPSLGGWFFCVLLLVSGLFSTVAFCKVGMRYFWSSSIPSATPVKATEAASVLALLLACVWLTVRSESTLRYTRDTAAALHAPGSYILAVLSARPRPGPTRPGVAAEAP